MKSKKAELPIPATARRDKKSREMIRAWIAENDLWCSINIGSWEGVDGIEEPRAWGILLADVAHHVANALHEWKATEPQKVLQAIRKAFLAEVRNPASTQNGKFVKPRR